MAGKISHELANRRNFWNNFRESFKMGNFMGILFHKLDVVSSFVSSQLVLHSSIALPNLPYLYLFAVYLTVLLLKKNILNFFSYFGKFARINFRKFHNLRNFVE